MFGIYFFLIALVNLIQCRSNGVSDVACSNLIPIHGDFQPQSSIANVQIVPHAIKINRGQQLKVTMYSSVSDFFFRGFIIQARTVSNNKIVGSFSATPSMKTLLCGYLHSTACHNSPSPKSNLLLVWKAPANFRGNVRF